MNPYVAASLAPQLELARQQYGMAGQQQQANAANATMSGNYGGTAQGVQGALLNNYTQQNVANTTGQALEALLIPVIEPILNPLWVLLALQWETAWVARAWLG